MDNDQTNTFRQIPSYTTVDLKLKADYDAWTVSGQVNNVFDKQYYEYAVRSTTAPRFNAYPVAERTVYLSVTRNF
jgi:iron complex outermembrane receptor protein